MTPTGRPDRAPVGGSDRNRSVAPQVEPRIPFDSNDPGAAAEIRSRVRRALDRQLRAEDPAGGHGRVVDVTFHLVARGLAGQDRVRIPDIPPRTLTRWLRRQAVPPPHEWLAFGRCLSTLHQLERSDSSIGRAALETGWAEQASFHRACRRLFGLPPGALRGVNVADLLSMMILRARGRDPAAGRSQSSDGRSGH